MLQGCSLPGGCKASGSVKGEKTEGGKAKITGEAKISCEFNQMLAGNDFFSTTVNAIYAYTAQSISDIDFSDFNIDLNASNAYIPNQTGNITIELFNASQLIASRTFQYTINANSAKLSAPDTVKYWVESYQGIVNKVDYHLEEYTGNAGVGEITVTQKTNYRQQQYAVSTAHTTIDDRDDCRDCMLR